MVPQAHGAPVPPPPFGNSIGYLHTIAWLYNSCLRYWISHGKNGMGCRLECLRCPALNKICWKVMKRQQAGFFSQASAPSCCKWQVGCPPTWPCLWCRHRLPSAPFYPELGRPPSRLPRAALGGFQLLSGVRCLFRLQPQNLTLC